jgi:ribosomal protein L16 Arg81 hydroxylase
MFDSTQPIDEIAHASIDDFEQIQTTTKPVVLRGIVKDWPLVKEGLKSDEAAEQYLRSFYRDEKVHALVAPKSEQGRYFYNQDLSEFNFSRMTGLLTDILDRMANQNSTDTYYVGSTSVNHVLPGLTAQNQLSNAVVNPLVSIWIGNQSRVAAHYDIPDNLACVAVGQRRFTLFPPQQLENLYVGPLDYTPAGQSASLVDFRNPDFTKFPKFKVAMESSYSATLNPGDGIFIPSMWWHHVESFSQFNVLINYWWRQVGLFMGAPLDALNHALLSIRDLPESQREAWKNIFEHYVFSPQDNSHIPVEKRGVLNPIDEQLARQLRALLINKLNR